VFAAIFCGFILLLVFFGRFAIFIEIYDFCTHARSLPSNACVQSNDTFSGNVREVEFAD
jgi:hypothetical protein